LRWAFSLCFCAFVAQLLIGCRSVSPPRPLPVSISTAPTPAQIIASRTDIWGEAALRQPGGPTYDYFARLLPPLRYVDADFHVYPIPLSAPGSYVKGRLLADGSQINALAHQPNWVNEMGMPVHIFVGDQRIPFGQNLSHLSGPRYLDGYLPIVQMQYNEFGNEFSQEVFASVDQRLAYAGAILARFTFPDAKKGRLELRFDSGYLPLTASNGKLFDSHHKALASFDDNWQFNSYRSALTAKPDHARTATVAIYTQPISGNNALAMNGTVYDDQRRQCMEDFQTLLDYGTTVEVPEQRVNDAWRSLLIGSYTTLVNDRLNYSASNQYARMYPAETGDAITALVLWGHAADAALDMPAILRYRHADMDFHDAAFKLQTVAAFYRLTQDGETVRSMSSLWEPEIDRITQALAAEAATPQKGAPTGLLPREQYCTDINTLVYNLSSDAACWRALRDMAMVLDDIGESDESQRLQQIVTDYRIAILKAINKNIVRTTIPPFIPIALCGEESLHDPITATRLGSYWNLVIGYVLDSGVFPYNSQLATDIIHYQQTHDGLCMGMIRCQSAASFWRNTQNIDDLYGIRYALTLLKRDEPDRALVSFYGKLAQGLTRDTYIGAEGTSIQPLDSFGRQMYLPPNTTSGANFLQQLRYLLIQDWDLHDTGRPDTLRLLFATPRTWLSDGKSIIVRNAPTTFGTLSMTVHSQLQRGEISADLDLPDHVPQQIYLRLRLPDGHKLLAASAGGRDLKINGETIDLAGASGHVNVDVKVK
jgi:hypothetical protein